MSYCSGNGVPSSFAQGDSVSFQYSDPNLSPSSWELTLAMLKDGVPVGPFLATADADGVSFDFALTPAQTTALPPGFYTAELRVTSTDGMQSFPLGCRFNLFVAPGLGIPLKNTPEMTALAALKSVNAGTIQSYSGGGVTWSKRNMNELRREIDRLQNIVNGQLRELGLSTKGGPVTLIARF